MTDIKQVYYSDIAAKKQTARGIRGRASRRKGFKGGMLTPVDFMYGKEKKEYMGNSEVESYITYEAFKKLRNADEKEGIIAGLVAKYGVPELAKKWGVERGIVTSSLNYYMKRRHSPKVSKPKYDTATIDYPEPPSRTAYSVVLDGSMNGADLIKWLEAIGLSINVDRLYSANVEIVELMEVD